MRRTLRRVSIVTAVAVLGLVVSAVPAMAQGEPATREALNMTFFLVCMALVFLMHPGFSMLEAGLTQSSNAGNIMTKNMMVMAIAVLAYFAVGSGLMYGTSAGGLVGTDQIFLLPGAYGAELEAYPFLGSEFMFDAVFAATAATIVSGAVAGRMHLWGFMLLATVLTAVVYPVVGHWGWADGWLTGAGFTDFAGSTVVHLTGGAAALTAAAILGPRPGRFDKHGKPQFMPGHSMPLAVLGAFLLWLGWFGFNGGSVLNAELSVGPVLVTTALAAAAGAVAAMVVSAVRAKGKTDVSMVGNGLLAGFVGITAGADAVEPFAAVLVGLLAGLLVSFTVPLAERLGIDDAVGAFSVHGAAGALGTWWVGLFAVDGGLLYGGGARLLLWQVVGTVAVAAFVMAVTTAVCLVLRSAGMLRVPDEAVEQGLDVAEHGVLGYPEGVLAGSAE